jgi:glycine/D-amino acid oxidase-like deaminating enzyme
MWTNKSPWIHQLDKNREAQRLLSDRECDVAIIGAGIAGVSTAFFLIKYTDKKVMLLDGGKLAHGATGHNGGQLVSYFEKPFYELTREFGLKMARDAQESIDSAWTLLDEMYGDANLDIPIARFQGHAGIVKSTRVLSHLKDEYYKKLGGLTSEEFLIADSVDFLAFIPREYEGLYQVVPQGEILKRLEVSDTRFIASLSAPKGCMNSALFCQEVTSYMIRNFPERFSLFEHSHVNKVVLKHSSALLDVGDHTVTAANIVLCTNGFENITILNDSGLDIDTRFHHCIDGVVGFMSGYLKPYDKPPTALSYIIPSESSIDGDYFYLTRREYEYDGNEKLNLVSIGGPEAILEDRVVYTSDRDYPEEAEEIIDNFARNIFEQDSGKDIKYEFKWHGLMGYTTNGVRLIGPEPKNSVLLYNLGCNGVGLLPSIYGGRRIARFLGGEEVEPSIFDPRVGK